MNRPAAINPVPAATAVIPALRRASAATGVDFNFLLEQARTESSLDPKARASTSSARGLFQFIDSTWLEVIDRHGARHGLAAAAASISRDSRGRPVVHDATQLGAILELRDDPYVSAVMAGELARENAAQLKQELGRDAKPAELYMAHFLGAGGASTFLSGLQENPDIEASYIVPAAARANQAVFYRSGKALSLDEVYARFEGRFPAASQPATQAAQGRLASADAAATVPLHAAALAAQSAILAARQTLRLGTEELQSGGNSTDVLPEAGAGARAWPRPGTGTRYATAPTPDAGAATLLALQLLQSLALPGDDAAPAERLWRA